MAKKILPVRKTMCATCPFRPGSKYAKLANHLAREAIKTGNRICHSTGSNAINHCTGKPAAICRGARNIQLDVFTALGVLKEPTDAEWDRQQKALRKGKSQ